MDPNGGALPTPQAACMFLFGWRESSLTSLTDKPMLGGHALPAHDFIFTEWVFCDIPLLRMYPLFDRFNALPYLPFAAKLSGRLRWKSPWPIVVEDLLSGFEDLKHQEFCFIVHCATPNSPNGYSVHRSLHFAQNGRFA